ncbi:PAS domain-containing protein [Trichothermofontia sp.]
MSQDLESEVTALRAEKQALEQQLQACQQRLQQLEAEQKATTVAHYRKAWQQLTFLLEQLPLATIIWDAQFRVQQWSHWAEQLFGWSAAEVVGKTMYDWNFIFEADREHVNRYAQALLKGEQPGVCQNRNYCKDGTVIGCEWFNSVLLDAQGNLLLLLSVARDISESKRFEASLWQQIQQELADRQQAEQSLQALNQTLAAAVASQTAKLQLVLALVKIGIWEWDITTNRDEWSPETYEILGLHRDEKGVIFDAQGNCVGTYPYPDIFFHCVHPDDRDEVKRIEAEALAKRIPFEVECRLLLSNGEIRWVYERGACTFNEQGEPVKLLGMIMDISDRKQIEIALRQSEARLKEAQQVAHLGHWEFDVLTETITWSDELFRIFGLSPDGPPPTYEQIRQSYPPEERERHDRVVAQILATGEPYEEDFQIIRPDGSLAWIAVRGHAEKDQQGRVIRLFGTTMDVSDRKATEAQLQQAVEELEHLNQMKDDFLSTVSHELRTPITNMKLSIRMLAVNAAQPESPYKQKKIQQYLTVLDQECEREISLINDLLDLQRLEANKHQDEAQILNVKNWLSEFVLPFQERANARQQTMTLECPIPEDDATITCEVNSLERIVSELINNACKYTPPRTGYCHYQLDGGRSLAPEHYQLWG